MSGPRPPGPVPPAPGPVLPPAGPVPWSGIRRLLVVRLDNIGDVVLLSPALRALRAAMPAAAITLLASPAGAQAAPLLPWIDEAVAHRALWQDLGHLPFDPAREARMVADLAARRLEAAVIFTSFSQSPHAAAYACYLAGIPTRLGQSKEFGGGVLSHPAEPPDDALHQAERNLHLLEAAGLPVGGRHLELRVPPEDAASARRLLARAGLRPGTPYVVAAPGASCAARRYDAGRFARAAAMLARAGGLPVVVVGSARERELAGLFEASGRMVPLIGRTTVPQLAAVVRDAALVLANNSAAMHLADAFARPVVALYAGTDLESQWRPRRSPAAVLRVPTACAPCYGFHCPYGMACLEIPPRQVAEAALRLLGRGVQQAQERGDDRRVELLPGL